MDNKKLRLQSLEIDRVYKLDVIDKLTVQVKEYRRRLNKNLQHLKEIECKIEEITLGNRNNDKTSHK